MISRTTLEKNERGMILNEEREIMEKQKAFGITMAKGFHLTFPNGYTISTQFGGGNYCENKNTEIARPGVDIFSNNVEIGIWDKDGKWVTGKAHKAIMGKELGDLVDGWVGITNWKKYLDWTASRKKQRENK